MHLDSSTVAAIIAGPASAFAVEVLTKAHASSKVKRWVALLLAALAGVLPTVAYDPHTGWGVYVFNVGLALASQQALHRTGVTDKVEQATANVGIGGGSADTTSSDVPTDLVVPPPDNPGDVGDTSPAGPPLA